MAKELNIQTIQQTQAGNSQSLSVVAEQVRQKVYTYIHIPALNTRYSDGAPGIAPDESFLVFNPVQPRGLGDADLYLSLRQSDGTWTTPRNLGPRVNSAYLDIGPYISPDKKYMFFTRSNGWYENPYRDNSDIYWMAPKEYLLDPNGA